MPDFKPSDLQPTLTPQKERRPGMASATYETSFDSILRAELTAISAGSEALSKLDIRKVDGGFEIHGADGFKKETIDSAIQRSADKYIQVLQEREISSKK